MIIHLTYLQSIDGWMSLQHSTGGISRFLGAGLKLGTAIWCAATDVQGNECEVAESSTGRRIDFAPNLIVCSFRQFYSHTTKANVSGWLPKICRIEIQQWLRGGDSL